MCIVIVGGNEGMVCQYREICEKRGCKAKIFVKERGTLRKKLGCPDLLVLFVNTVSHRMVMTASSEARRVGVPIARVQSSGATALAQALDSHLTAA